MLTSTQIAGFAGAGLAGAAYVPQISHLARARCSAGISRLAFAVWLLALVLPTARALGIGAGVFIVVGGIQIVATTLILLCAIRYQGTSCPVHAPGQPAATAAGGTGGSGNEPGYGPACGRRVAGPTTHAGHGAALRASGPVQGGQLAPRVLVGIGTWPLDRAPEARLGSRPKSGARSWLQRSELIRRLG